MAVNDWIAKRREALSLDDDRVQVIVSRRERAEMARALDALEKVLELHVLWSVPTSEHYFCEWDECDRAGEGELRAECQACREWWPCPTVAAITEALGVEP